jgi:hypothetical protein
MFTSTLFNMAVLVYFAVSSGHGAGLDLRAGRKAAAKVEEKVVLREDSLSEKLGLEAVTRPDQEIVALRSDARGIKAALVLGDRAKTLTFEEPPKYRIANSWDKRAIRLLHQEDDSDESNGGHVCVIGLRLSDEYDR